MKFINASIALFAGMLLLQPGAIAQISNQSISDYFKSGARWTECYYFNAGQYSVYENAFVLYIADDSLVNGIEYKLLYSIQIGGRKVENMTWPPELKKYNSDTSVKSLIGGIRVGEDNVYLLDFAIKPLQEKILYDFTINIGDTLNWKPYNNVVLDIDNVKLENGQTETRYHFSKNEYFPDYWIRGVGSNLGILGVYRDNLPTTAIQKTHSLCFSSGSLKYKFYGSILTDSTDVATCYTIQPASIASLSYYEQDLVVFPNPVYTNNVQIDLSKPVSILYMYDITGRKVYELRNLIVSSNYIAAPKQPGMYFISVLYEDGSRAHTRFEKR